MEKPEHVSRSNQHPQSTLLSKVAWWYPKLGSLKVCLPIPAPLPSWVGCLRKIRPIMENKQTAFSSSIYLSDL